MLKIVPASREHIMPFTMFLRSEDRLELKTASEGAPTWVSLTNCLAESDTALAAFDGNGHPVMLGGIKKVGPTGYVWGVATDAIKDHIRDIAFLTKPLFTSWFTRFGVNELRNHSLATNTLHHRWLKWAGAVFGKPEPVGPNGELFVPFTIHRTDYV